MRSWVAAPLQIVGIPTLAYARPTGTKRALPRADWRDRRLAASHGRRDTRRWVTVAAGPGASPGESDMPRLLRSWWETLTDVRRDEVRPLVLMIVYGFLAMASYYVVKP